MMEQFYFVLTERCNLACSHCIRDSSPYRDETAEKAMILDALSQIRQDHAHSLVLLTGGEPTLHRHFDSILRHSLALGLQTKINSNGVTSFYKQNILEQWAGQPSLSVQISLDGTEAEHDLVRGAGTYRRALRTLARLRAQGISCSVSATVIDLDFFARIEQFIQPLDDLELTHIAIKRATYAGRASSGMEVCSQAWNQHVYALRKQPYKTRILAFPMYDFSRLQALGDDAIAELGRTITTKNCGAATAKVYIYPNGDVCSCTCFKAHPMGNLYQQPLSAILAQPLQIKVEHPTCQGCRYFAVCNGGCLGSGYQHTGELGEPDPRCPQIQAARGAIPAFNI
ncbi:radical SAM/SPASM domain-containing protein [Pseudomonas qingdaonensis]|jgi:radical SAM protein with 4Fe4S-binding SPASM domain|uniref:radical SAM/SPASM domain-containing protein n=1 Tax=Pseudomonas qingdaonensis TaxID=2056231 RepID=UPI000C29447B|nr:radical SAM protein [Pseudomonas qingdaonensis]